MDDPPFWAAESVAAFLREQAAWRHAQAKRFPADRRNFRSASALEQLAAYVEALPATDLALNELIAVKAFEDDLRFIVSDEARRAVTRYGFDDEPTPRTLLQELVAITRRARRAETPAHERKNKMAVATPSNRTIKWLRDRPGLRSHAVRTEVDSDQVMAYCGMWLSPEHAIERELGPIGSVEGACSLCEAAISREAKGRPAQAKTSSQAKLLDEIFSLAIAHDTKCQRAEDDFYRYVGYRGNARRGTATTIDSGNFEDLEGPYRSAIVELCATIAAAALRRVSAFAGLEDELVDRLVVTELTGDKLEEFLRPIFEESGVGERFEVRRSYEVFKREDDD